MLLLDDLPRPTDSIGNPYKVPYCLSKNYPTTQVNIYFVLSNNGQILLLYPYPFKLNEYDQLDDIAREIVSGERVTGFIGKA